jgi:type II secretory pathway pseudopilin PulG
VENAANHAVCDGQMTLAAAQHDIATNWIALGQQLGVAQQQAPATQAPSGQAATCSASASYSARYGDWDVYVHSNQPDQTVDVTTSGGATASYHTNSSGYADVYLHAPESASGQRVSVTVGSAACETTL